MIEQGKWSIMFLTHLYTYIEWYYELQLLRKRLLHKLVGNVTFDKIFVSNVIQIILTRNVHGNSREGIFFCIVFKMKYLSINCNRNKRCNSCHTYNYWIPVVQRSFLLPFLMNSSVFHTFLYPDRRCFACITPNSDMVVQLGELIETKFPSYRNR